MKPLFLVGAIALGVLAVVAIASGAPGVALPAGDLFVLGDSLSVGSSSFGGQLVALLEASGRTVEKNALGGRSAASFMAGSRGLKEPSKGAEQLRDVTAKTALILLGTNDLAGMAVGNSLERTLRPFRALVAQLRAQGVEVYGVGAPHFNERPEFWPFESALSDGLRDVYGADHFIDAGPLTGNYKMHAGGKSAREFAARVFLAAAEEAQGGTK